MLCPFWATSGTCSRARQKPLPRDLQHPKATSVMPITWKASQLCLDLTANRSYLAAVQLLLEICRQSGSCVSVENPLRSCLWPLLRVMYGKSSTNNIAVIEWYAGLASISFDACAHGSNRKRTKLLATSKRVFVVGSLLSWQPYTRVLDIIRGVKQWVNLSDCIRGRVPTAFV